MLELATEASKALSSWPVVNGFFIIVITFLSYMAMRRGERDRKNGGSSMEIPMFLMGGPVHDVMGAVHDIAEETRTTNAILRDIAKGLDESNRNMIHTHRLLENIYNSGELRPARSR